MSQETASEPRICGRRPRRGRARWSAAPLACAVGLTLALACGTDAVGVDTCRRIETARCRLAATCGTIEDAAACERFYRDQCLHGLPVDDPGESLADACVQALEAATECARSGDDAGECADACGAVSAPESLPACAFLVPDQDDEDDEEEPDPSADGGAAGGSMGGEPAGAGGTEND